MSKIPSAQSEFQNEETAYRSAVSESLMTRMGANMNYFNDNFDALNTAVNNLTFKVRLSDLIEPYQVFGPAFVGYKDGSTPAHVGSGTTPSVTTSRPYWTPPKNIEITGVGFVIHRFGTASDNNQLFNLGIVSDPTSFNPAINRSVFSSDLDISFIDGAIPATDAKFETALLNNGGIGDLNPAGLNNSPTFNNVTLNNGEGIALIGNSTPTGANNFLLNIDLYYKYV